MADRETLDVYAARAAEYDKIPPSNTQDAALAGFLARLAPGAHILDLGCGPGLHAGQMMAEGFTVTAHDATPAFVEAARASMRISPGSTISTPPPRLMPSGPASACSTPRKPISPGT